MPKIVALIPARKGSKSIPLKNIKLLNGKPLLYWVSKAASECSLIDKVYVATDSCEIKKIAINFLFNKLYVFDRLAKNAEDKSSTEDLMLEFINNLKLEDDDLLILLQATSPFTQSDHLVAAISQLKEKQAESLLSATITKRFFWSSEGMPLNYDYNKRPRRQDFKGSFVENGAFYINKVKNIKLFNNRISPPITTFIMPEFTDLELDEPNDWVLAEQIIAQQKAKPRV